MDQEVNPAAQIVAQPRGEMNMIWRLRITSGTHFAKVKEGREVWKILCPLVALLQVPAVH